MSTSEPEFCRQDVKAEFDDCCNETKIQDVYAHIETLREFGINDSVIRMGLIKHFNVSDENADKFMRGLIPYPGQTENVSVNIL